MNTRVTVRRPRFEVRNNNGAYQVFDTVQYRSVHAYFDTPEGAQEAAAHVAWANKNGRSH